MFSLWIMGGYWREPTWQNTPGPRTQGPSSCKPPAVLTTTPPPSKRHRHNYTVYQTISDNSDVEKLLGLHVSFGPDSFIARFSLCFSVCHWSSIWVYNCSIWFASELAARRNNADICDISKINENVTQTLFIIFPISLTSKVSLFGDQYSLLSVTEGLLCPCFCFRFEREGLLPTGTIYLFPSVCLPALFSFCQRHVCFNSRLLKTF